VFVNRAERTPPELRVVKSIVRFSMTPVQMLLEKDRRLAADLAALGPEPPWWRPRRRRRWRSSRHFLTIAHASDLDAMLRAPDDRHRAATALLIGWISFAEWKEMSQ
jgi:hypothetical protein